MPLDSVQAGIRIHLNELHLHIGRLKVDLRIFPKEKLLDTVLLEGSNCAAVPLPGGELMIESQLTGLKKRRLYSAGAGEIAHLHQIFAQE